MDDSLKAKFFREMSSYDSFKAQIALEEETYNSLLTSLLRIDTSKPNVDLEYARLRGSLDALKSLKANRERLTQDARSREQNS